MVLDILVLIITGYGFYSGFSRGIIDTVFDAISILVAVLVTLKLSPAIISLLSDQFNIQAGLAFILGFVITFFAVMWLIKFIGSKIENIFKAVHLNFVNQLAGGVLLGLIYATVFSFIVALAGNMNMLPSDIAQKSATYSVIDKIPNASKGVFRAAKPVFESFWDKTIETIDRVKERTEG